MIQSGAKSLNHDTHYSVHRSSLPHPALDMHAVLATPTPGWGHETAKSVGEYAIEIVVG
jgi:hypothetical protein